MLSYRHHFHAGNHADVLKHAVLVWLLRALHGKESAFRYHDTHAGAGRYDLASARAEQNREFEGGIGRLWARTDLPDALREYVDLVRRENPDGKLRFYPGSPLLGRRLLRKQDRMVLTELNDAEVEELEHLFAGDKQVQLEKRDGYDGLRLLPPPQRRGVVLVDSSFDRANELTRLVEGLTLAHGRWATGVFALWYPLMDPASMEGFEREVVATGIRKVLQLELSVMEQSLAKKAMRGSGLLVVNPPWKLEETARPALEWLAPLLAQGSGAGSRVRWLVPE